MKDLAKGLEARWKLSDELAYSTTAEEEKAMRQLVSAELDLLKGYTSESFENSKLQERAIQYINLLNDQMESLQYVQVDYAKYTEMWSKAYNERSKMLVDFVDNYGLTVSDEYLEVLTDMKVNASLVAEKEDKQAKIDALGESMVFEDEGDWHYVAVVENNTGFDIAHYSAKVILLDEDGVNIDTQYIYADAWSNGQKARFDFYAYEKPFASTQVIVDYWE